MPFFAILTSADSGIEKFYPYVPLFVAAFCAIVLLIAFCVGFKKGARRVSWGGFVWLFAVGLFLILNKIVFKENNPLVSTFSKIGNTLGKTSEQATQIATFFGAFVLALASCVIALVLYGVCTLLFRPSIKRIKKNADIYTIDEEGIEYDEEYYDYDDYEEYESRTTIRRKGYGTPSIISRILGGGICAVNAAMVLAVIVFVALFAVDATSLKETALGVIYKEKMVVKLVDIAGTYALDVAFIGIIIGYACKGQSRGFMDTLRMVISSFGGLVCTVFAFYVPFSAMGESGFLGEYVSRCIGAANSVFGESIPQIAPIIGRVAAGLILCIFFAIMLKIVDTLLKKIASYIYANGVMRAVDGAIACVIYFVVGIIIVVLIWAVWFVLSYYGIFRAEALFSAKSSLSSGMFATLDAVLSPILQKIAATISGLLG